MWETPQGTGGWEATSWDGAGREKSRLLPAFWLGQWAMVIRSGQCGPWALASGHIRGAWGNRPLISLRGLFSFTQTLLLFFLTSFAAISFSIHSDFNKPWMSSRHHRSTMTEHVLPLQTAWISAQAWSLLAPRRTSTSGFQEPPTSQDIASSGPVRPASASQALWIADGLPPCASAGGWRRWTTLLRLWGVALRPTPASACPRWRSCATPSSTSRACRSCYENRWKTFMAYLERAALSLEARCLAALMAW